MLKIRKGMFNKCVHSISRSSKGLRRKLEYGTCHISLCGKDVWKANVKIEKATELFFKNLAGVA
jgi:hypothetical protein